MRHKISGFTIVELLSVLTMLAVFMGVLFPVGEKIIEKSRRAATASDLRQIALAYGAFLAENEDNWQAFAKITKIADFAKILAESNYITDAALYYTKTDPEIADKELPKTIGIRTDDGFTIDKTFAAIPAHFVVITKISKNAPQATTPVAYTRGLNPQSGSWDKSGVYGQEGGYVAFLDGHVKFYKKVELLKFNSGELTNSIKEAVNQTASAFDYNSKVW